MIISKAGVKYEIDEDGTTRKISQAEIYERLGFCGIPYQKSSRKKFYGWVKEKYFGEDSPFGDLARDISRDESFPATASYDEMLAYLKRRACRECIATFKECYKIFEKECVNRKYVKR